MRDVLLGSLIAAAMAVVIVYLSPGHALLVTFLPGLAAAWLAYLYFLQREVALPSVERLLPVFVLTLAVQLLHFAEEYVTGFQVQFGPLYGGDAMGAPQFVAFNMVSYAVFAVAAVGVSAWRLRPLMMPVLFFAVYGALGNAIAHLVWAIMRGGYFPGLGTSLLYWAMGPWLLSRLGLDRRALLVLCLGFGVVLVLTVATTLDLAVLRTAV